ncbi:TerC/Alx family metal homeostasis membrane protein [Sabulilitoribacter multivorans]|uniref:TerC/Alx family metal homeostasis membrane protein n=1 Tax=Flaviramulus multivorans TaxID=1304750 RepID=A0ABS9IK06_9FLAO|nr:TerC/Alx family metal homeostasis membrane protein [Flaviramulus multivorans]MCF7560935.1 TerC/Alx family metal homeostasis membrane protein [Flaviramulus multivorans]
MIVWIIFISVILIFLALDLGVFNKTPHIISTKEASIWTFVWISIALSFSFLIYVIFKNGWVNNPTNLAPVDASLKYVTGYLIELSLSVDNIFVIAVIFSSFRIPQQYQHRVLFWGIMGAIVFRAVLIFFGVTIFTEFEWITYVFGVFLILTAIKLLFSKSENEFNPKKSFVYRTLRKVMPISSNVESEYFFVRKKHLLVATPLFLVLILIEFTDILFAFDSIPAILAITTDPFIVFSSNILAILGLRSMYFFLSNMTSKFYFIKYSLVAILGFVGIKLLLAHVYKFPEWFSLGFILLALLAGIVASLKSKASH